MRGARVFSFAPAGAWLARALFPGLTPRAEFCRPCRGSERGTGDALRFRGSGGGTGDAIRSASVKLIVTAAVLLAAVSVARPQGTTFDSAWNARMAALQEEHDAQTGVAVSIVFDDSGSMNDSHKLEMAKKAFRAWIEHAPDSYRFGLVTLNEGEPVKLQRNDRAQILAAVNGLEAEGGTPLADTVARVGGEIRQRRKAGAAYERQVVVILTDGEDTSRRGIKGVQEEIRHLRRDGVEVIAFGYQGEGDYMRESATHFYSPENEQDISRGLNAIGAEIADTSDVVIDDATRAAMQTVSASDVPGGNAAAPAAARGTPFSPDREPPSAAAPTPAAPHPRSRSSHHGLLIALVVICALLFSRRRRR